MTDSVNPMATIEPGIEPKRIVRQPQVRNLPPRDIGGQQLKYSRMQMEVEMSVHMIQWQSGLAEFFKLRVHLSEQLVFEPAVGEVAHSHADGIKAEEPLFIHEVRNFA